MFTKIQMIIQAYITSCPIDINSKQNTVALLKSVGNQVNQVYLSSKLLLGEKQKELLHRNQTRTNDEC